MISWWYSYTLKRYVEQQRLNIDRERAQHARDVPREQATTTPHSATRQRTAISPVSWRLLHGDHPRIADRPLASIVQGSGCYAISQSARLGGSGCGFRDSTRGIIRSLRLLAAALVQGPALYLWLIHNVTMCNSRRDEFCRTWNYRVHTNWTVRYFIIVQGGPKNLTIFKGIYHDVGGVQYTKIFSSLSGVRLVFWLSPI